MVRMSPERRTLVVVIAVASAAVLALVLWPHAKEGLAPELVRSYVAVQAAGSDAAAIGPTEIEAGTDFTLHAVLEAHERGGGTVYYTVAPALEIDGEPVPAEALRPWDRAGVVKIFWFTVEGPSPYVRLEAPAQLDRFAFTEFFRPEWPSAWSIPGRLEPRFSESLEREAAELEDRRFGTQRFQVRIEIFEHEDDPTPRRRFISAGGDALPEAVEAFPTVYAALPGPAGPASLAFGLTELEPPASPGSELHARIAQLTRDRLAFSRVALVGEVIQAAGRSRSDLAWADVDLGAGPPWGAGEGAVGTGDLVRAGPRVVVLFRDRGIPGRLDREDLCFDYERGASVRPLSEVFSGEGLVELARL